MGGALTRDALVAFTDELEQIKEAGAPEWLLRAGSALKSRFTPRNALKMLHNFGTGAKEQLWGPSQISLGHRLSNIPQGMKAGWEEFGHIPGLTRKIQQTHVVPLAKGEVAQAGRETFKDLADFMSRASPAQKQEILKAQGFIGSAGEHILQPSQTLRQAWKSSGTRGVAEELSRSGYTGSGKITKYLPIGQKTVLPAFSAMAIPDIVNAPKSTPTSEGGAVERGLGEAASLGGMIFTGGMGIVPGLGGMYLAGKAGGRIGRVIDRLRAGGNLDQATMAPSPEEATQQLERIQKHYG